MTSAYYFILTEDFLVLKPLQFSPRIFSSLIPFYFIRLHLCSIWICTCVFICLMFVFVRYEVSIQIYSIPIYYAVFFWCHLLHSLSFLSHFKCYLSYHISIHTHPNICSKGTEHCVCFVYVLQQHLEQKVPDTQKEINKYLLNEHMLLLQGTI